MRNLLVTVAVLVFANSGTAAQLPTFELTGAPITADQSPVVDDGNLQGCVSFTDKGSFWTITNHCTRDVYVRWHHDGHCDSQCGTTISGGVEQPIIEPRGRYSWTVRYQVGLLPF